MAVKFIKRQYGKEEELVEEINALERKGWSLITVYFDADLYHFAWFKEDKMKSNGNMQEATTDAIFDSMKIMAKLNNKHLGTDAIIAANVLVATLKKYENMGPAGDLILSEVYKILSQIEIKEV